MSKKVFKSQYTDSLVTGEQLLAEQMCERQARRDKKTLGSKFWNNDFWAKEFKKQLRFANQLTKCYDLDVIFKALKSWRGKRIYSLGAKSILDSIIKGEAVKKEQQETPDIPEPPKTTKFLRENKDKSKLSKLD